MSYPGRPPQGKVLWGASVGTQNPVTRHEIPAGVTMELQRLFYRWNHVESNWAMQDIESVIDAGRFPWVSFKLPGSWDEVARGEFDEQISNMLDDLDAFGTPIWLTMHHEPEGGGGSNAPDESSGPEGHKAMNRRVRSLMDNLQVKNIALSLVLMGWTWDPVSGRDPDEWWDDCYDFLGIDPYVNKPATMLNANWDRIMAWAREKGVDVGVAEWGIRGENEAAAGYMAELYDYCVLATEPRVTSLAYFDVIGDWSHGPWVLEGPQLDTFHEIMQESAAVEPEPEQRFEDVPPDHTFFEDIEWIAAQGITKGCNPPDNTKFCPSRVMTRGEMAAMLHRALGDG